MYVWKLVKESTGVFDKGVLPCIIVSCLINFKLICLSNTFARMRRNDDGWHLSFLLKLFCICSKQGQTEDYWASKKKKKKTHSFKVTSKKKQVLSTDCGQFRSLTI